MEDMTWPAQRFLYVLNSQQDEVSREAMVQSTTAPPHEALLRSRAAHAAVYPGVPSATASEVARFVGTAVGVQQKLMRHRGCRINDECVSTIYGSSW
jgi:hypothetical protein